MLIVKNGYDRKNDYFNLLIVNVVQQKLGLHIFPVFFHTQLPTPIQHITIPTFNFLSIDFRIVFGFELST
jgi:hypothetical protein